MASVSPDSAESGLPLPEVSNSPFSDIPLEMWSPDTAYLLYQQAKQLSMTCRRRGNFAFADKDFRYAACQYTSALLLTSFEEEDLLMTIPQPRANKESLLELLPPMLYYKANRVADRFIFRSNRAECWLRVKGMHDRANLDASNAIEEIQMMAFELAEMYPIETLMNTKSDLSDQVVYRSLLVSDDLWYKNERRIKRAEECYQLEKRQEESYYNDIEEMDNEIMEEDMGNGEFRSAETDYSDELEDELDEEKQREIAQIIANANAHNGTLQQQ
jgi:hypothetical protein